MREEISQLSRKSSFLASDRTVLEGFLNALEEGTVRAAEKNASGLWRVNTWVKEGILCGFRMGVLTEQSINAAFRFFDKDTYPLRHLTLESGVRLVPGGSAIRRGACVSAGVTCMPPMYVNVGAFIGVGTMIDSHALVGSCAQVGEDVHISASAQIGGVLEPVGALPVIIEDGVLVGGNCGVYEGSVVRAGAVLGAGVILTASTRVYDLVHETVYRSQPGKPLEIPPGAVVVPGSRKLDNPFARQEGLSVYAPMIVKYRDEKTETSVQLADDLR